MEWVLLIIFVILVVVGAGIFIEVNNWKKTDAIRDELDSEFPEANIHVSSEDQSFCVVDFDTSRLILGLDQPRGGVLNLEQPYRAEYDFSDIAAVEVRRDETTIASTNRGSQALGAAAGALAFGGVGAIIGGLSGSSTQQERVRHISLVVKVRDQSRPLHNITFFYWGADKKGVKMTRFVVQKAISDVETFAAHVANAIYSSEKNTKIESIALKANPPQSIASQIKELLAMKESGVLSGEEFNAAKSRLIAGN